MLERNALEQSSLEKENAIKQKTSARIEELRTQWIAAKRVGDRIRMNQCKFMAESIKSGELTFVY